MVNKVILIGRLGRDPELRTTQGGKEVATFSLATSRKWKDRNGERQEDTEWHNIVAWDKLAGIVSQYYTKGSLVYVEGRLKTRSWDDKNSGEKKYMTEVIAYESRNLTPRRDEDAPQRSSAPPEDDDSLPF